MIGQRIGSYTIVEKLGEGGMGVVYRATDSRLHRDVALKFIPEAMAKDPQIMGRFEREAQVLASLNHPNIASIYGLEENAGQRALVMELASGEELATRIARGKIPLEEALRIALAIAEALEAAHEKGIIHRDLKPANIKLGDVGDSGGGRLKILDFGLAKALQGELGTASGVDLTRSPTLSVAATQAGMILGTASYMSPEQARALPADRRADIWSFGVILYEMLAGRRAFLGDTVADTVAKVIEREPDLSLLPATTPPPIKSLIERCLVKSPRNRLQSIGDARLVIEETLASLARPLSIDRPEPTLASVREKKGVTRRLAFAAWGVITVGALAWAAVATVWATRRDAGGTTDMRVQIAVGQAPFDTGRGSMVAFAPDGKKIAYIEGDSERQTLFVRALDELVPVQLTGKEANLAIERPYQPFFSPDGKWVGFVTTSGLFKVQVTAGAPIKICDVSRSRGATWLPDDTIVIASTSSGGLSRVRAVGGELTPLTKLDKERKELSHRWPQALPGGDQILFTSQGEAGGFDNASLEVLSLESGERKVIYRGGSYGRYAPSGHLVFTNSGTLFTVPFDLERVEVEGSPVPVLQNLAVSTSEGGAQFDFSPTGLLAYVAAEVEGSVFPILWVDREGKTETLLADEGVYANPRLSPDGRRLSLTVLRDNNWDVWVHDLERGVGTRLTFGESVESEQIWSPDGGSLIFSSDQKGPDRLFRKRADGSGEVEALTETDKAQWANSWSSDGRYVAFIEADTQYDLWVLDLETGQAKELLATEFGDGFPDFSPDGRWITYASNESGSYKVYVRPFPEGHGKWQVSEAGGGSPRWSKNGKEIFWRTDSGIAVADVDTTGGTFRAGKPRMLFDGPFQGGVVGMTVAGFQFSDYDVAADGQRFVMFPDLRKERGRHQHITLVTNWFDDLERFTESDAQ